MNDIAVLKALPCSPKFSKLCLSEYPFDHQLLTLSGVYRTSRSSYIEMGGTYSASVSSLMRSLSTHDLFKNEIEYSPSFSEMIWFCENPTDVHDSETQEAALSHFNQVSVFHEQNHRIVWSFLPPAPSEERDLCRYLNFAESIVVSLDLALADEIGPKLSPVFERMRVIYRTGTHAKSGDLTRTQRRDHLHALLCSTYFVLELINPEDILAAVDYVLPGQKKINKRAVQRSLEISELFTRVTNPQWQERHWKSSYLKLKKMHRGSMVDALYLPEDPLDFQDEFAIADRIYKELGL
jgi:hypothetical protein